MVVFRKKRLLQKVIVCDFENKVKGVNIAISGEFIRKGIILWLNLDTDRHLLL